METKTNYEKQATDFLQQNGLTFKAAFKGDRCPDWCGGQCVHGDRYWITIYRKATKQRLGFEFWNSYNDMQSGTALTPYSVLACISVDIHCSDSFEGFCNELGYSQDSIKHQRLFKKCNKLAIRLRNFFTITETDELSKIQ